MLILIIIIICVIVHLNKKANEKMIAESPMKPNELDRFRLPETRGFARVSLPVTNEYRVPMDSFVAFDVETANAQPYSICSISAVKVENRQFTGSVTSLIKPPEAKFTNSHVHGITWSKVRNSPTFKEFYESTFRDFIKGFPLVAHNANFDMGCLIYTAKTEGITLDKPLLFADSLQSARYTYRNLENYKLDTICKYLNLDLNHHESLSDAKACAQIMQDTMDKGTVPIIKSLYRFSEELFVKAVLYEAKIYAGGLSYESLYKEKPKNYSKEDFIRDFVNPGTYARLVDVSNEIELNKLHKADLQKILADAGLPTKGLKKDLIAAIIEKKLAPPLPADYVHQYKIREDK